MKLIGSHPSPYVRRNRIFLENIEHEFVALNIYGPEGRAQLSKHGPIKQIPILIDGENTIYDSRIIYRYLNEKYKKEVLTFHDENIITMINACNDAQVNLLMLIRSDVDVDQDKLFMNNQRNRVKDLLDSLNEIAATNEFDEWNFKSICLYCLLDWMLFRALQDLTPYSNLLRFVEKNSSRKIVQDTDPRKV